MTNEAEITGQVTLEENTTSKSRIVQAPLNAKYVVLTISVTKKGFQSGTPTPPTPTVTVTGVSFSSITWTTDIPASGGTATKENCSYVITADYDNGNRVDITTLTPDEGLLVEGSKTVSASTDTSRHSVGSLSLDITYFPEFTATTPVYTATTAITAYQEAYKEPAPSYDIPLTFDIISEGRIYWHYKSGNSPLYSIDNGINWDTLSSYIDVSKNDKILVKGGIGGSFGAFSGSTAGFKLSGNIMSLVSGSSFENLDTITSTGMFMSMFNGCTGLTDASDLLLPATTLADSCYQYMFAGCTSLTKAPELPATTLADYCYRNMFDGCTSLTTAPSVLPAPTLAKGCYQEMFINCTSLTTAPELPATDLVRFCYRYMFTSCSNLNSIKCLATTNVGMSNTTDYWLDGVASIGSFVKNPNKTDWERGPSGIPEGWSVLDNDS